MPIDVKRELIIPASGEAVAEWRSHIYLKHDGLERRETRTIQSQGDTSDFTEYRDSSDNGKTWGEWIRAKKFTKEKIGEYEIEEGSYSNDINVWNPVHKHYLTLRYQVLYIGGYEKSLYEYWNGGRGPINHAFVEVKGEDDITQRQLVSYEKGANFEVDNFHKTDYLSTNMGLATGLLVLKNGDIIFGLWTPNDVCCKILGCDVNEVTPSNPLLPNGILVCRGVWNRNKSEYDITFSKPIIIDDRFSSRGFSEPIFAELESGKILAVLRASNVINEGWKPRISPYAPSYKFYIISDDGGKTFTPPMPWHFDTREVIYSSATYSLFLRSSKNGKLYWIGNITEPEKTYGNYPRYPLHIVEIDEDWGHAKKETLAVIDTKNDGDSEELQLSNFSIIEDRETKDIEIYLAKLGQFDGKSVFDCESWKYTVTLE